MINSLSERYEQFKITENKYYQASSNCLLGHIVNSLRSKDVFQLFSFFFLSIKNGFFELPHPDNSYIMTRARLTITLKNFVNLIVFSDEKDENVWVLHQSNNFIEYIVTENSCYSIFTNKLNISPKTVYAKALKALKYAIIKPYEDSFFSGFLLSHYRPFHYFYDRLLTAFILNESCTEKQSIPLAFSRSFNYFPLDELLFLKDNEINEIDRDNNDILVSLCSIKYYWLKELNQYQKLIRNFEQSVAASLTKSKENSHAASSSLSQIDNNEIKLWIGITGQKRSWVEQIEGYTNIIKDVFTKFNLNKITVYIDGFTAPFGETIEVPEDNLVVKEIKQNFLNNDDIKVISLVGLDYVAKIKMCSSVDAFIANAGTGSMVPLRFCNKPGVLHSNSFLYTFPDTYTRVEVLNKAPFIKDVPNLCDGKITDATNYSIDWNIISESLSRILKLHVF